MASWSLPHDVFLTTDSYVFIALCFINLYIKVLEIYEFLLSQTYTSGQVFFFADNSDIFHFGGLRKIGEELRKRIFEIGKYYKFRKIF